MPLQIKRGSIVIDEANPSVSDYLQKQRNGVDFATLNFLQITASPVALLLDDYIEVYGRKYYLIDKLPEITKLAERKHQFSCIFEAEHYKFKRLKYYSLDPNNNLKEKDFTINGDLQTFASLLILNINRVFPEVWSLGQIDTTEVKLLPFSNQNCLEVCSYLVEQFQTEFWVDGNVINFSKKSKNSGLSFAYGQGNGLYEITRTNESENAPITNLTVFGGSKNLPEGYRNFSQKLQLDNPFVLPPSPNNPPYNEDNIEFPEVFPKFVGTVSAVFDEFTFECEDIPFNVNMQLIAGTSAKVIFQTGQLAGYQIDMQTFDNATKKFVIKTVETEQSLKVPQVGIEAAVGDLFIIVDIKMPVEFVADAEALLAQFGQEAFNEVNHYKSKYSVKPDPIDFKRKQRKLVEGDLVTLTDDSLGINRLIPIESFKMLYVVDRVGEIVLSDYPDIDLATKILRKTIAQGNAIKPPSAIQPPRAYAYNRVANFTRDNCTLPQVGSEVQFSKRYVSGISLQDAEDIAMADASYTDLGQAFANANGTCEVPKIKNFINISDITSAGDIAEVTVVADFAVKSTLTVVVRVVGATSGKIQFANIMLSIDTLWGSAFTVNTDGAFNPGETLNANVFSITPDEDGIFKYEVGS